MDKQEVEVIAEEFIRKELGTEEYCETCEAWLRMLKIDCEGEEIRCIRCLQLYQKVMVPVEVTKIRRGRKRANPLPSELRAYADKLEQREKEEKAK